ncbi:MAG: rpsF [Deltaproteobacteria bacterium]|nr:rpsF [Deltaproteobacteria bacterium]
MVPGLLNPRGGEEEMRRYETIFIASPELSDDDVKGITEKVTGLIEKMGGQIEKTEDWGTRKLAYEVKKKSRGHYVYVRFSGKSDLVAELERNLRINEGVIKYQSVLVEDKPVAKAAPVEAPAEVAAEV